MIVAKDAQNFTGRSGQTGATVFQKNSPKSSSDVPPGNGLLESWRGLPGSAGDCRERSGRDKLASRWPRLSSSPQQVRGQPHGREEWGGAPYVPSLTRTAGTGAPAWPPPERCYEDRVRGAAGNGLRRPHLFGHRVRGGQVESVRGVPSEGWPRPTPCCAPVWESDGDQRLLTGAARSGVRRRCPTTSSLTSQASGLYR